VRAAAARGAQGAGTGRGGERSAAAAAAGGRGGGYEGGTPVAESVGGGGALLFGRACFAACAGDSSGGAVLCASGCAARPRRGAGAFFCNSRIMSAAKSCSRGKGYNWCSPLVVMAF
jgi:hypothetical protein